MYFFERERSWSPTLGVSKNLIRNNIFLTRVPKIIDVMFLLENPPAAPLPRLFRVTVMWRLHADRRWTVLCLHLIYVIPSLGCVNFNSFPAFIWEILNKRGIPDSLSCFDWLNFIYSMNEKSKALIGYTRLSHIIRAIWLVRITRSHFLLCHRNRRQSTACFMVHVGLCL